MTRGSDALPINPKDLHAIDPFELVGAPFDLCLGLPALHGLRKGVNNNVLRPCESRLFVRGPGIALVQPVLGLFPEWRHLGVLEPGWVSVVLHYGLKHITFLKPPPVTELLILEPPLQKLLRTGHSSQSRSPVPSMAPASTLRPRGTSPNLRKTSTTC